MSGKKAAVVIDVGSSITKYELAGEYSPKTMPTAVGIGGENDKEIFFGAEKRDDITLKNPMESGEVKDWETIEKIWRHIVEDQLHIPAEERRILLAESPSNPKPNREKATEIMFEALNVQGFYIGMDAILSLYATGAKDGLVVESGHGVSHVVASHEGNPLFDSIVRVDTSGMQVTHELAELLSKAGININDTSAVSGIKEKCCGVALDFDKDVAALLAKGEMHELPDGQKVTIGDWKYRCTEGMFNPQSGIQQAVNNAVSKCEKGLAKGLFGHIALSGGNTLFPGFSERFEKEINALAPSGTKVRVVAPPNRNVLAWIGGSVLASLEIFQPMWITKEEYKETGPSIVRKKCI